MHNPRGIPVAMEQSKDDSLRIHDVLWVIFDPWMKAEPITIAIHLDTKRIAIQGPRQLMDTYVAPASLFRLRF